MAALLIPPTRDKSCPPPTPEEEEALASGGFDDIDLKGLAQANDDLMNLMKTDPGLPKETRRRMEIDEERAREEELEKRRSKKDRERIEAEKAARVLPRDRTSSGENTAGGAANASSQVRGQGQGDPRGPARAFPAAGLLVSLLGRHDRWPEGLLEPRLGGTGEQAPAWGCST